MVRRITIKTVLHRNKSVLRLNFPYDKDIVEMIRAIPGVLWSNSMKCWYVPDTAKSLASLHKLEGIELLIEGGDRLLQNPDQGEASSLRLLVVRYAKGRIKLIFKYDARLIALIKTIPFYYYDMEGQWWSLPHLESVLSDLQKYCTEHSLKLEYRDEWVNQKVILRKKITGYENAVCPPQFEEKLKTMRYSESTVRNYCSALKEFIHFNKGKEIDQLKPEDIEKFLLYITEDRNVSTSYHNISICAIKFYYEKVLQRSQVTYHINRPRREKILPEVLGEDDIRRILSVVDNLKHKCILMTIYSGGLRLSEVVGLRISDIDSGRMMIFIKGAKGNKDRYTILSKELLKWLREYYKKEKPDKWLFEGVTGGQYSMRSVQNIMKEAVKKAGIKKHATVHTLRHSFATHMLENGTDLRYIQNLLGHNSSKTTEIYTHITTKGIEQLTSPFDRLGMVFEESRTTK
jgi:integrase/recombinase XerD